MFYLATFLVILVVAYVGWKFLSRGAYETATYTVLETDGRFEIRKYPDLVLVTTSTELDSQGKDGSFMWLFRYISGANESGVKVAMTTPVFMEPPSDDQAAKMAFVMPNKVAEQGAPEPTAGNVVLGKRAGGSFAVVRFAGRLS